MSTLVLWLVIILCMLIGMAGVVIPGLPGVGLIYLGILFYGIATGFTTISFTTVVVLGIISVLALLTNYAGSAFGSRYGGGKKWAVIGTAFGAIIGATIGPLGIFLGAFLGALIGAFTEGASHQQALKVAVYSVFGILGSVVVQFLLAIVLIISFFVAILV